jgi:hypothetical protein
MDTGLIDTIKTYINTACQMPDDEGQGDVTTEMEGWADEMSKIRVSVPVK